jgi:hypothetical protein
VIADLFAQPGGNITLPITTYSGVNGRTEVIVANGTGSTINLSSLASVDAPTRKRRLFSFLARRGYDSDAISRVLRIVLAGDPAN